jgi:hypothetical protein
VLLRVTAGGTAVKEVTLGQAGVAVGKNGREVAVGGAEVGEGVAGTVAVAVISAVGLAVVKRVGVTVSVELSSEDSAVTDGVTVTRTVLSAICWVAVTTTVAGSGRPLVRRVSTPNSSSPQPASKKEKIIKSALPKNNRFIKHLKFYNE